MPDGGRECGCALSRPTEYDGDTVGGEQKEISVCVCVCVIVPPIHILQLMCKGERGRAGIWFSSSSCSMQRVALPDIRRLSILVTCFGEICINNREFRQSQSMLISLRKMDLSPGETQIWCAQGTEHLSMKS